MKIKLLFSLIALPVILLSCHNRNLPVDVGQILKSNKNESALLEVINHYSKKPADSLKLKAAYFLIKVLDGRYYYSGKKLEGFMKYPELVLRDINHGEFIMASLSKMYGDFNNNSLPVKYDLQEITSEQMISNIDQAFIAWNDAPWHLDYSFDQFCEFILPFRINDEIPSYNRKQIYQRYKKILDSITQKHIDAVKATKVINDVLINDGWILSNRGSFLPNYTAMTLVANRVGTCREMADLAIYVMRSVGIPVVIDFVPQWPYRSIGHTWNVVIDKNGMSHPFLGAEDSPGTPHKARTKKGKVYRRGIKKNEHSLAVLKNRDKLIPGFLNDPYITDVTDLYVKTYDVNITLPKDKNLNKIVYLCVYNNKEWIPVAWSKKQNNSATFNKMEGGILYLPAYFGTNGVVPLMHPIKLGNNGISTLLKADTSHLESELICDRIYPVVPESFLADEALDSKFEGANKEDFSDAQMLFKFKERALPYWNELHLSGQLAFQYYRYVSSQNRRCQLSELAFYNKGTKLSGKLSGDEYVDANGPDNVKDGDITTSFRAKNKHSNIRIDFGRQVTVDKVMFVPRLRDSPNELIIPGQTYELNYWSENTWKLIKTMVATSNSLKFEKIPSNSLFTLNIVGKSDPSRIFTVKNKRQEWF